MENQLEPTVNRRAGGLARKQDPFRCASAVRAGLTADGLLKQADAALYSGKAAGGNSVTFAKSP